MTKNGNPIAQTLVVLPREPCHLARIYMLMVPGDNGLYGKANQYLQAIQNNRRHSYSSQHCYHPSFLTGENVATILDITGWNQTTDILPEQHQPGFHVLLFNQWVDSTWPTHLIPSGGYTVSQIKTFSHNIITSFAALDITKAFEKCPFFQSLFGSRLQQVTDLPVNSDVIELWSKHPETVSYWYIHTLVSLFNIFNSYINNL